MTTIKPPALLCRRHSSDFDGTSFVRVNAQGIERSDETTPIDHDRILSCNAHQPGMDDLMQHLWQKPSRKFNSGSWVKLASQNLLLLASVKRERIRIAFHYYIQKRTAQTTIDLDQHHSKF